MYERQGLNHQPGAEKLPPADFPGFARWWMESRRAQGRSESFLTDHRLLLKLYLAPVLGNTSLRKIGPEVVGRIEKIAKRRSSSWRANRASIMLKQMLKDAVALGLLKENPLHSVARKPFKRRDLSYWTPKQAQTFLAATRDDLYWPAYALALHTGMSIGELLGLCWEDVDLPAKKLRVARIRGCRGEKENVRRARVLPLGPEVLEILFLLSQNKIHPRYVISGTKSGKLPRASRVAHVCFVAAIERAGVPRIRFGDLRTSFVWRFLLEGGNITALAAHLGYSLETAIQQYAPFHALFWPREGGRAWEV